MPSYFFIFIFFTLLPLSDSSRRNSSHFFTTLSLFQFLHVACLPISSRRTLPFSSHLYFPISSSHSPFYFITSLPFLLIPFHHVLFLLLHIPLSLHSFSFFFFFHLAFSYYVFLLCLHFFLHFALFVFTSICLFFSLIASFILLFTSIFFTFLLFTFYPPLPLSLLHFLLSFFNSLFVLY